MVATRSLSYHLGLLVLLAAVPMLVLVAGLLVSSALISAHAVERRLVEAARLLGAAVEAEAAVWTAALHALAIAPGSSCEPSPSFHAQASAIAARHGGWIALEDESGRTLMSPPGHRGNEPGTVRVAVQMESEGEARCWLSMGVPLERFAGLIKPVRGDSWTGVLMDSNYAAVASSGGDGLADLRHAPQWYIAATGAEARGVVDGDGWPAPGAMRIAFVRINDGRWVAAVAAPRAEMQSSWMVPVAAGVAASLALVALSLASAAVYARRVRRQMNGLLDLASRIGGEPRLPAPPSSSITEVALLGRALADADEAVRQRRAEHELHMAAEARRAAAESADRSKDLFLATLSHELRGSLTAVIGWLDIARSSVDRTMLSRALEIAMRNARQQARMIDDLLDVSRIVSGKFTVERHPVELCRLAREALDSARPAAEEARIELRARLHEPVFVEGDRARLLQVLGNLLGNAIKFNRAGGWVELALEQREGEARVVVTDNGQGINEAELPRVFERFWQAEPAGRGRSPGLGLGLQLVHYIVEKHGGYIAVESAGPGRGARFTVRLPGLIGGSEGLHGIGVLALDDDRDTLDWLQHFFAAHGATTWVAHTAEEAMRLAVRVEPDVLISNLRIGVPSGQDLIQGLRAQHLHKRVATLAFSAQPTGEERMRALAAGYDAFIECTSQPDPLLRAVRAAVKGPSAGPGAALRW